VIPGVERVSSLVPWVYEFALVPVDATAARGIVLHRSTGVIHSDVVTGPNVDSDGKRLLRPCRDVADSLAVATFELAGTGGVESANDAAAEISVSPYLDGGDNT
jgi:hypothetical protein